MNRRGLNAPYTIQEMIQTETEIGMNSKTYRSERKSFKIKCMFNF